MTRALFVLAVAAVAGIPATVWTQDARYPITLIAPGKGPFTFPAGYQTPWEKIDIRVTEKMSPNLFVLHGSQGLARRTPTRRAAGRWRSSGPTACCWSTPRTGRLRRRR